MEDRSSSPPPFSIGDAYRLYCRSFGLLPRARARASPHADPAARLSSGLGTILAYLTFLSLGSRKRGGNGRHWLLPSTCSSSSTSIALLARRFVGDMVPARVCSVLATRSLGKPSLLSRVSGSSSGHVPAGTWIINPRFIILRRHARFSVGRQRSCSHSRD